MKSTNEHIEDVDFIYHSIRNRTNNLLRNYLPKAWKKFAYINSSLQFHNIENYSNSVNSCRRILKNLSDFVYPATDEEKRVFGKLTTLTKKHYKNRIMAFLDSVSSSKSFKRVIRSDINLYWKRLYAIHKAGSKGAHDEILSREEVETYVLQTYLLVGDILGLWFISKKPEDLIRGLDNTIFYISDSKKTSLSLYYTLEVSPYKLVVSRNAPVGTRLRIYIKKDNEFLYDYDIQNILPNDIEGFENGELSEKSCLQIGTYQFSNDSLPMLLIAVKGKCSITLLVLEYEPKNITGRYFREDNWKIAGRFQGQSFAIISDNYIYMPFGSVGFANVVKYENGFFSELEEVLLKKENIFGEHPDL